MKDLAPGILEICDLRKLINSPVDRPLAILMTMFLLFHLLPLDFTSILTLTLITMSPEECDLEYFKNSEDIERLGNNST
jgi:hypothetical protein